LRFGNEIPFDVHCDLIKRALDNAMKDLNDIRANESRKKQVRAKCITMRVALGNARHHLRESEASLGN
jgi:hypothetical protein